MIRCRIRFFWLLLLTVSMVPADLLAQSPSIEVYRVRVVTRDGHKPRGILSEINETNLFVGSHGEGMPVSVSLSSIRKVVIRRNSRKGAQITGAVLGSLLTGYASVRSLEKSPSSSPVLYGVTVLFSAASGALAGVLTGSLIGNLSSRVIRPLDNRQPEISLFHQLEPLTVEYQQNLMNRLPSTNQ